jgi:hypothetical protein
MTNESNHAPLLYKQLYEQVKDIDTSNMSDDVSNEPTTSIIEEQKVYFWTRLYLKNENKKIEIGDAIKIVYTPSDEELITKFVCYEKSGLGREQISDVTSYNTEDDRKVLCLMIDSKEVNFSDTIPFLRTLFKIGHHYEYQLIKRDDLLFIIEKSGDILDWYDVDF